MVLHEIICVCIVLHGSLCFVLLSMDGRSHVFVIDRAATDLLLCFKILFVVAAVFLFRFFFSCFVPGKMMMVVVCSGSLFVDNLKSGFSRFKIWF